MTNAPTKSPAPDYASRTLRTTIASEKNGSAYSLTNNHFGNSIIVRPRDLPDLTGLSKTSIWRLEKAGEFPRRIKLSPGAVGYRISEIQAWLDSRQTLGGSHGK